jgi:spore germination cell wall hydrolase CwlJ-like protein
MATSSYSIAPGSSSEDLALRRKLAAALMQQSMDTSPVDHWAQGLARMGQAALGGYQMYQAKQEDEAERKAGREALIGMLGGEKPEHPLGPITSGPRPASASPAFTGTQGDREYINGTPIYSQDEVTPMDVPQGAERDRVIRTVYGEAANQGPTGQQAVANVIRNRAVGGATTPTAVVTAPNQFEPWNTAAGRQRMAELSPNDPMYGQIGAAVDRAYAGDDPTGGATHFYAPTAQAALGRPTPSWAAGQPGQDIGDHRFFRLGNAGAGTPAAPQQRPMGSIAAQPQITPQQRAQLTTLLGNRVTAPMAQQMIMGLVQRGMMPTDPKFEKVKSDDGSEIAVWANPRNQTVTRAEIPQPPQAGPSVIPPAPPGVDPKIWRQQRSERVTSESMPAKLEDVQRLRKEVQDLPSYKNLAQAAPIYKSMREAASRDNRAADVNMIYGLGKIMDPTSVVRESEMSIAQMVATLPQHLRATVQSQLQGSGRLSPEVREAIMQEAYSRIQAYQGMFDQDAGMYRGIATRGRMNTDDVLPNFGKFEAPVINKPANSPSLQNAIDEARRRGLIQ